MQLPATSYAVTNFNMLALGSSNNIFATSPLFVDSTDADGPDNINRTADDGFALQATSPCINSGRVMANSSAIRPYDIRYETRIFPDMGAYEKPAPCMLGSVLYVDSSVSIVG